MFVDKDLLRENFHLNSWHRWPTPLRWWQYGILLSGACSICAIVLLVFGR